MTGALLALAALPAGSSAQTISDVSIIPRPASITLGRGAFALTRRTVIWTDPADTGVARRFARELAPATGVHLTVKSGSPRGSGAIAFVPAADGDTTLGGEGYRLDVTPSGVTITSATPAGAFYATRTILQLLPPEVFQRTLVRHVAWRMPAVSIEDRPQFRWRGMHLDVARHFMPKAFVEKYIDLLALHKMNVFHWHLTDDQGWRIQIKRYPRLTTVGAWRRETVVGKPQEDTTKNVYDHRRYGGYYTQADIRQVVAYARHRFVTIVPEIEMPGHSQAAIAAYPSLGNFDDTTIRPWTSWGVTPHILNPSDTTIAFMENVLTEVMALFPGPYIHTGGDEAIKPEWKASPRAQERIKAVGLKNEDELQGWFTGRIGAFLRAHGRRLVGWDEILEGNISPDAVVMVWRDPKVALAAAQAGHDVVMTPGSYTYFDHYQSLNHDAEPLAIGGYLPLDSVYAFEPDPAGRISAEGSHMLGAQGQVWTEYLPTPKAVEYMAFPRECALAEVLWTPTSEKSFSDFMARLPKHLERLRALGINYRRP